MTFATMLGSKKKTKQSPSILCYFFFSQYGLAFVKLVRISLVPIFALKLNSLAPTNQSTGRPLDGAVSPRSYTTDSGWAGRWSGAFSFNRTKPLLPYQSAAL